MANDTDPNSRQPYKVFVSSTYIDNKERRKTVRDSIAMAGMVWHGMEIFTASTEPTKEECLRFAQEADVLVGIIAWRYGWEPEGEEKSITELEYDAANERLMFLIDPELPVNPAKDFDPEPDTWKKQEKLAAFKKRFTQDQMLTYFNESNLSGKVLHALTGWRKLHETPAGEIPIEEPEPDANLEKEIRSYRDKAESLHASLPVAGFVTHLKVPIDIEDIYVPLRAMIDLRGVAEDHFYDASHAEEMLMGRETSLEISLPKAFRQSEMRGTRGIVILGDPGSGKTTHLKRLLLWCLRNGPETIGLPEDMLPVFLPLRDLRALEKGLGAFIENLLASPHLKSLEGFGERLLARGNLIFLLDGLDEVADLARREQVVGWIMDALRSFPSCRFVVTCRFAGYSPTVRLSGEFLEMHIRPLNKDQADSFVRNWYKIVERGLARDPEQAEEIALEKAEKLITGLREPDFRSRRVFELTRNPLLLANICLVHRHRGGLPQKRARLYKECIDVLLEHWREAKELKVGVTAQEGRSALQPAALWLHREKGRTKASAEELSPHIDPVLKAIDWTDGSAGDFLHTIRDESGLLTGWDQKHYGFMHLGFQEYLAAREIRSRAFEDPGVLRELAGHFGESWWEEVALLMLALEDPSLFTPYMREVVKRRSFVEHSGLVEMCLNDAAETSTRPFIELLERDPGKDKELWNRQITAFQILSRMDSEAIDDLTPRLLRHPSPDIRRLTGERASRGAQDGFISEKSGYKLVRIRGGVFIMGSPGEEDGRLNAEEPLREVDVPEFYIGRYLVTNEEYERFLFANPNAREPVNWSNRRYNQPNQPVVGVSWEDAKRYAAWSGLHLPSEAQWEYACRAGKNTRYYTGDSEADLNRAGWYEKNSGGRLHPVGEKEPNAFGLYDMHGNAWEWVEDDLHKSYEDAPSDGSAWVDRPRVQFRILRGGGWNEPANYCRSANRDWFDPGFRRGSAGFRLAAPGLVSQTGARRA